MKFTKKSLILLFLIFAALITNAQDVPKIKIYGSVNNEFYYNSRLNEQAIDGIFNLTPKPIEIVSGLDKNATPQAEMISVNSRLGIDITGSSFFGAKSTGKIEADFAGFGVNYYVLRIRQAYAKLNWEKSELLLGQTWHPMFGSVSPTIQSANAGAPFQTFNRSPQLRFKYNLNSEFSLLGAAIYEMQHTSQGPLGANSVYMKNALVPNLYFSAESKKKYWLTGVGLDIKTLKPSAVKVTSISALAYTQYVKDKFQLKAKVTLGQNLTEKSMLGGYGVSGYNADSTAVTSYTNFNNLITWINAVYGSKVQVGLLVGLSENLGTTNKLMAKSNALTSYGIGNYTIDGKQILLSRLIRVAPHICYNLPGLKLGLEYELTSADFGILQNNGLVNNPYSVANNRIVCSITYSF